MDHRGSEAVNKCAGCSNWMPRKAPRGMAALGFAPCSVRSISKGHTFSAHTSCDKFAPAEDGVEHARLSFINRAPHGKTG